MCSLQMNISVMDVTFAECQDPKWQHMNMVKGCVTNGPLPVRSAPKPSPSGATMRHIKSVIRS